MSAPLLRVCWGLLLVSWMVGCAPRGPALPPLESGADGGRIVADLLVAAPCPAGIASDLELTLRLPEEAPIRMHGSLRAIWPDRLRMQTRIGAFWPVASIAVQGDSAFLSFPRIRGYWAGTPAGGSGANPAALAGTILWLLCPGPLAGHLVDPVLQPRPDGWGLIGRLGGTDPPVILEMILPEEHLEVTELVFRDPAGTPLLRAERHGRIDREGMLLPAELSLRSEDPPVSFDLRLLRPRVDPDADPEIFRIERPEGSRWIPESELLWMFNAAGRPG